MIIEVPIAFFNEREYDQYERNKMMQEAEDEDLDEFEKLIKKNNPQPKTLQEPKAMKTTMYIERDDISSFHASFLWDTSVKLDGTAVYTKHGQIFISTLPIKKFKARYDGIQTGTKDTE